MKRFFAVILSIVLIIPLAIGQDVNVTASFDTSEILIGDQIGFRIEIDQPSDINLSIPFFTDTISGKIEILEGPVIDSSFTEDSERLQITEKYLITSFDSGFYQIPPVYAEVRTEDGLKRFFSDYSHLMVSRVNIPPSDSTAVIYDIISPYRAPYTAGEIIPWIMGAILLGVLIWLVIRYIKKMRRAKEGNLPVINPDPPHVIAFRELEKLREDQFWQRGETKKYYTRLTEIIRRYLENRYQVSSPELTTAETLDALISAGFNKGKSYDLLETVLTGADMVKFAKYIPDPVENDVHFQKSWDFVAETKEDNAYVPDALENEKTEEESDEQDNI